MMNDMSEGLGGAAIAPELIQSECLPDLFEHQASARSGHLALVCRERQLTYGEVNRRANQIAHWLRRRGVGPGDAVGLLLPRSEEMLLALLGILKAGAAYVPLDPDYPAERVTFILADCQAKALVTTGDLVSRAGSFAGAILDLSATTTSLAAEPSENLARATTGLTPGDLAYIIYTSGTTGRPKGVELEHRSVCHLVRAESRIFQVLATDRVYQGFSLAFDASVEEIWLAFFAGATLVVGDDGMRHAGAALSGQLTAAGVTVLSCVPTLLAMLEEDLPSVRLLILGGEVCPPDLVRRWWRPHRRLVNTYGPTEATVIATWTDCHPEQPVTIGRTVPNYFAALLDAELRPCAPGADGELCLGGIGLARGYVARPDLTREKFITANLLGPNGPDRWYRTGDRARWNAKGELEFLGRIDTQVKIRGFRVELAEIEAALLDFPAVQAAAVTVREEVTGLPQLIAYIVPRAGMTWIESDLRNRLRERLPVYMVPALIESLGALPTLPSGKVDRQQLRAPRPRTPLPDQATNEPLTEGEQRISAVWQELFAPLPVALEDDFFLALGGHSLLAARMVSQLRPQPGCGQLSMLDVYQHPTIKGLAAELARREAAAASPARSAPPDSSPAGAPAPGAVPFARHFWCGLAQLLALPFILTFFAAQWMTPYLVYTFMIEDGYDRTESILSALAGLVGLYPIMLLVVVALKWIIIGRYRAGSHPLWGPYYFRWWLITTLEAAVPVAYLAGTPLLNIYFRMMGARLGKNVHLDNDACAIYDLLTIGDNSSINVDANLAGYLIADGQLHLGSITIGNNCFVGTRSAVGINTRMEDTTALEDLSLLPAGGRIPRGQTWLGSPARPATAADRTPVEPDPELPVSAMRRFCFGLLHAVGVLIFPVLVSAAIFPGIVVMNKLNYIDPYYWYLGVAPLAALSFLVLLCAEITILKWLLLGRVAAGRFRVDSFLYLRKWFVDQTLDLSLDVVGPLYGSLYLAPWYRMLGAKIGVGAEISTASFISPDLLSIDDESFIADSVSLGAPRVRNGWITLGRNHVGKRSFIGNSAMLPPGTVIGDDCLIGCLSAPPRNPADALRRGTSWLGSPAIFLPQRQATGDFPVETTFHPSLKLRIQRAVIEFVRVILPSTGFIILLSLLFSAVLLLRDQYTVLQTLLLFPALYIACGLAAGAFTVALKWILVGRYRPCERPLWSTFVWRNELINALHEHLAEPFLVGALTGTPFVCWYFRLLGARIGHRVYMETTDFSEFDLAHIGDGVELNADCTIQTHLFEDRVMKMSTIDIAARATVGAGTLVLYDTRMESGASLGTLSLLMKGEVLPARTSWQGIPARRVEREN